MIQTKLYNWLKNIQFALLPGTCVLCLKPSDCLSDLCAACEQKLKLIDRPCPRCALPLPEQGSGLCGACLVQAPTFRFCVAPLVYAEPVAGLISGFKFQGQLHKGKLLSQVIRPAVRDFYRQQHLPLPDVLIPVPLHRRRLRQRGFNQALLLCRWLQPETGMVVDLRSCRRSVATPSQKGLSAGDRRRNLRRAFTIDHHNPALRGKTVALVDDVVTTMSTVEALSRLLLKHQVREVHVWALARTVKD